MQELDKPRPFSKEFSYLDKERWITIYPIYIDSSKSLSKGRKVSKEFAVESPKGKEIQMVLEDIDLEHYIEAKAHPKELDIWEPNSRVRFRIKLFDKDGIPVSKEYPNRITLLNYIGSTIPKLKVRASATQANTDSVKTNKKDNKKSKKRLP